MSRAAADWHRQLRDSALEPLAARLGYVRDPRRRNRWRRPGSVLSIDGSKFFDHAAGRGGGGAIDLVLHARQCGFPRGPRLPRRLRLPAAGPARLPAPAAPPAPAPDRGRQLAASAPLPERRPPP